MERVNIKAVFLLKKKKEVEAGMSRQYFTICCKWVIADHPNMNYSASKIPDEQAWSPTPTSTLHRGWR